MTDEGRKFFAEPPEICVEWHDDYSPAVGWLIINSLRGGAAGGGTRMKHGCTKAEVVELAKTMEIKFTVSGPAIGGAKSGINYDFKNEDDKQAVLRRWFKFIEPHLKAHYGTGGDQNVDQIKDVFPLLRELGIEHPQAGIVKGFYKDVDAGTEKLILANLGKGVSMPLTHDAVLESLQFTVSDAATGYGVIAALKKYYSFIDHAIGAKHIIIEGFGNVGRGAAYYAYRDGAKIVAILDKAWCIIDERGIDIADLLTQTGRGGVPQSYPGFHRYTDDEDIHLPDAHAFIPAATSHTISESRLKELLAKGIQTIACGANNPFSDSFVAEQADRALSVIPDFIANAGMARVYSYLMSPDATVNEQAIIRDIDTCISGAMANVFFHSPAQVGIAALAERLALDKIESGLAHSSSRYATS